MKVVVTYNIPSTAIPEDFVCHQGVMDEVRDVTGALDELGYSYQVLGIGQDLKRELSSLAYSEADLVFNLCESISGLSSLQPCFAGYLELLGIPFTGSTAAGITVAIDKRKTKAVLHSMGISTPDSWEAAEILPLVDPSLACRESSLPFPVIVKPACEDGSIGIDQASIAASWDELRAALGRAVRRFGSTNVLVERYIEGREFYVGFLGNTDLKPMPVSEIAFEGLPPGVRPIMSYEAKWVPESIERLKFRRICPAQLASDTAVQIVKVCEAAYKAVGLSGYGRIDIRWEAATGELHVLDVNANPDITDGQGLPFTAEYVGLPYPQLIEAIIGYALERKDTPTCPPATANR